MQISMAAAALDGTMGRFLQRRFLSAPFPISAVSYQRRFLSAQRKSRASLEKPG